MSIKIKILIAEHDPVDLELLEYQLKLSGIDYVSQVVQNELDYCKAIENFIPDIILSDYTFPSFDGPTAFKIRQKMAPETPFIFVSGTIGEATSIELIKNGLTDYVLKESLFTINTKMIRALSESSERQQKKKAEQEKKNAEDLRKFDKNNLHALINNTNDLMWSVDRNFKLITSNQPFEEMSKVNFGKVIQKGGDVLSSAYSPEMLHHFKQLYERAFAGEAFTEIEHFSFPVELWTEISYYPIRNREEIIGTACHSRDITELKRGEENLKQSELKLKEAQAIAHISTWEIDLLTNTHHWSDEFYNIFGIKQAEVKPSEEAFLSLLNPEDVEQVKESIQKTFDTFAESFFYSRINTKDGSTRFIYSEWKFEYDKNNKPIRLYGILQDVTERKLADEKLKRSEHQLAEAQRVAKVGSWEIDLLTLQVVWSDEACRIFGIDSCHPYTSHEIFLKFAHVDDRDKVDAAFLASFNNNQVNTVDHRIVTSEGIVKDVVERWDIVKDNAGKPLRAVGIVQDITERKKIEVALSENENYLRIILDTEPECVKVLNSKGEILSMNPAGLAMIEADNEQQVLGYCITELVDEKYRAGFNRLSKEVFRGNSGTFEFEITGLKGGHRWLETHAVPLKDTAGKIINLLGVTRDITGAKKAEHAIKESEEKYRAFFENSLDGIILSVADGKILSANPAACEIFRMTEEEICSAGRLGIIDTSDTRAEALISERQHTGKAKGELTYLRKDGSTFPGEISSVLFKDSYGQERTSMIIRDITERKLAEGKMAATSKDLQHALNDLNKIMDSSLDVICAVDAVGTFIKVSAASEAVWGYKPEELIGRPMMSFVYDEDSKTGLTTAQVMAGTNVGHFENRYIRKDGSLVSMEWTARWDERDKVRYGVARDVTIKKRLERAFKNERQRFLDLFLQAPSFIAILHGPYHVYEMANPLYLKLTGRKDIIGKTVREVFPEIEDQVFFDLLDKVYATGESFTGYEMLFCFYKNDGELTEMYIDFVYQPYKNASDEIEGIFFFGNDVTEQVLSRKKIEQSEKQYRRIVETAQEGIWVIDENSVTTFVNDKMCEIFGYEREEMIGKEIYAFMDDEGKQIAALLMKKKKEGKVGQDVFKYISKSGKEFWTQVSANPLFDNDGKYVGALAMITDISEKLKAEHQNKFKAELLNTIGQAVIATDLDGIINFWNTAAEKIYGWTTEETLGKNVIDITPVQQTKEQGMEIMAQLAQGNSWSGEFVVQRKNGDTFPAFVTNAPTYDQFHKLSGVIGVSADVSERKKTEAALEKTNERLLIAQDITQKALSEKNIILESIGDGFFAVDKNWIVTYWNNQAEKLLGTPKNVILGRNLWEIFPNRENSESYKKYHEAIETKKVIHFEDNNPILTKWFEVSAYPSDTGLAAYFKDIKDRKLSEINLIELNADLRIQAQELAVSNAELEQFAYVASHDLQEPLRTVTSYLTLLEKKYENIIDDKGKKYIDFAVDGSKRMRQIIEDLLDYSKIGKTGDNLEDINLNGVINEIQISFQKQIDDQAALINVEELPVINSYKTPIRQAFQNLISNALKYSRKDVPAKIHISASTLNDHWQFCVADNGIGINSEYFDKIFIIFQRLHNKDEFSGTGIGLPITKKL